MRFILAILLVIGSSFAKNAEFEQFKIAFGKSYTTPEEEDYRLKAFQNNLRLIKQRNAKGGARHAVNKFADMTPTEFKNKMLNFRRSTVDVSVPLFSSNVVVPSAYANIDWRNKGNVISDVKDQGQCGSCWAFSATEETESMWVLAGKSQAILSPQQVVSCDTVDQGCNGGDTVNAYQYIQQAGGYELDSDYPYTSGDSGDNGDCTFDKTKVAGGDNTGYNWASTPCTSDSCNEVNETALLHSLQAAPISICVNAEPWQTYESGIMDESDCDGASADLDHCVQLVGYASKGPQGKNYYIVRNSWADSWGDGGYIYLAGPTDGGTSDGGNTCGVADHATIPKIVKK